MMTKANAQERVCAQHHIPRSKCDPEARHVQSVRCSDALLHAVAKRAATMGLSRNEGMEKALEEWTADEGTVIAGLRTEVDDLKARLAEIASSAASVTRSPAPGAVPFRSPAVKR